MERGSVAGPAWQAFGAPQPEDRRTMPEGFATH